MQTGQNMISFVLKIESKILNPNMDYELHNITISFYYGSQIFSKISKYLKGRKLMLGNEYRREGEREERTTYQKN